ncbi:Uncharacterized protein APZ42_033377 [Daphnia magna]|uniref:Uncharacterized protein n=1 Tax=Daphnia magna TaxID=35525 RepID=A0A164L5B5_9CRUS|nr:Uncharacterized protein APZ42_033377 [Daphnia magna]
MVISLKTAGPTVNSNMNLQGPSITLQQSPMVVKTVQQVTSPTNDSVQANRLRFPTGDFLLPNGSPTSPEVVEEWCSSTSCQNTVTPTSLRPHLTYRHLNFQDNETIRTG